MTSSLTFYHFCQDVSCAHVTSPAAVTAVVTTGGPTIYHGSGRDCAQERRHTVWPRMTQAVKGQPGVHKYMTVLEDRFHNA